MFGCAEGCFGRRFSNALTAFLNGERERKTRALSDALNAALLEARHE